MADLFSIDQLPTTSAAAHREFDDRYIAAQGAYTPSKWFDMFGDFSPVSALHVTFPINQLSLAYQQTRGESRFKHALEKEIDVKVVEFDEGIDAKLLDLYTEVFAWKRWQQGASLLVNAEERFRGKQVATLIEAGETTLCYDGKYFFDDDHPINPGDSSLGTYDNLQASAKDPVSLANIEAEIILMQNNTFDENGDLMEVDSSQLAMLVPTEKYESVKNLVSKEIVPSSAGTASENNPYTGLEVVHCPQFTDANDWFLVNKALISMCPPWLSLKYNAPSSLAQRTFDESSDYFKNTGKIKYSSHIYYGFAFAFPHAIRKIAGA